MSVQSVKNYLKRWGLDEKVQEFDVSSATVAEAALAVQCEENRIAKTMGFLVDGAAVLIVAAGDAKIDNGKYKEQFHTKAVMLKGEEVALLTGHPIGGVCPFANPAGTRVYLDASLQRFTTVFPACGSGNSAIELTLDELERASGSVAWINVCKGWNESSD